MRLSTLFDQPLVTAKAHRAATGSYPPGNDRADIHRDPDGAAFVGSWQDQERTGFLPAAPIGPSDPGPSQEGTVVPRHRREKRGGESEDGVRRKADPSGKKANTQPTPPSSPLLKRRPPAGATSPMVALAQPSRSIGQRSLSHSSLVMPYLPPGLISSPRSPTPSLPATPPPVRSPVRNQPQSPAARSLAPRKPVSPGQTEPGSPLRAQDAAVVGTQSLLHGLPAGKVASPVQRQPSSVQRPPSPVQKQPSPIQKPPSSVQGVRLRPMGTAPNDAISISSSGSGGRGGRSAAAEQRPPSPAEVKRMLPVPPVVEPEPAAAAPERKSQARGPEPDGPKPATQPRRELRPRRNVGPLELERDDMKSRYWLTQEGQERIMKTIADPSKRKR